MAKTSKRHPARPNKDHAGCMWGLMSIFDFRHGRTTKRLLSDRRHITKNTLGSAYPTSEVNLRTTFKETHPNDKDGEKTAFDLVKTRVKELIEEEMFVEQGLKKKQNDTNKIEWLDSETGSRATNTGKTSKRSFDHEISISGQKTSAYHDLEALTQEILLVHRKRSEQHCDLDTGAKRSFPIGEEKLIAAVEVLMKEKSTNGKDVFQMLSANKEILLKLLQDQNSPPLNEDQKSTTASSGLPVMRKQRKFFRRRSKSHESTSSERIVILKPDNQIDTERNASQFSFMEIKRRLKHAMGKEQRALGPGGKSVVDGGWSSPNRDHFYTERFARVSKLRETGDTMSDEISNIYVEAKRHLSEMLTSGDEDAQTMIRSLPKSLGRLLSIREYNSLSPGTSPRPSPLQVVIESQPSIANHNPQEKPLLLDGSTSQGVQEMIKSPPHDEEQTCQPRNHIDQAIVDDGLSSESFKPELSSSRTTSPVAAGKTVDRTGKPSPVSVLEPLFSDDDDISPARTVSRPVSVEAGAVEPLCIRFEEQIQIGNSGDSEESAFEYVEAVLLSSDLNWLEFEKRWLLSVPILDPSLFNEVQVFSSRPIHDQHLLFDSTNEVLKQLCDRFVPESSFIKRPVPKGMDLINEVWARLSKVYPRELDKLVKYELQVSREWLECGDILVKMEESIFQEMMDDTLLSLLND